MHLHQICFAFSSTLASAVPSIIWNRSGNQSIATGASECLFRAQWFTQTIDHFGQNNDTFQQKYYMTTEYYKPGGPILMFEGEETKTLDCVETTIMYDFAQELNGIAVALEHRYFGESKPFGSSVENYTAEQWEYLTLDNVMQDAVAFVDSIKANVTGAEDAPVFAASGSYGGFLMTMFRQNHPETFDGVIASAPALRAFYGGNDTNVLGEYNWWNFISMTYQQQSNKAAAKIKQAFDVLAKRFLSNNTSKLQDELGLCSPVTTNSSLNLGRLTLYLQEVFSSGVEFNYDIARPGRSPIATPLEKVIEIASGTDDLIQILNLTNWLWYSTSAASIGEQLTCLDWESITEVLQLTATAIETIPFSYITCTYLLFDVSSIGDNTLFLPTTDPALVHPETVKTCQEEYGISAPSADEIYQKYHFTTEELQSSTGMIFSLAEFDPTTAVSGAYDFAMPVRGDPYASRRIFTTGMAHREDLFAQDSSTKENVKATNAMELQILKEWMELARTRKAT